MASPRDVLGVVGRRHLIRMVFTPGPAGGIRPGAKYLVGVEPPRWNVLEWAGRATSPTNFPAAAARRPRRAAARVGVRSRGGHHPGKVRRDQPRGIHGGRRGRDFRRVAAGCGRPRPRPYAVECPAIQSSTFPRLITTVHKVPAGLWLSQVEHRTLNPAVGGSNPPRPALTVGSGSPAPVLPCRWAACPRTCIPR